MAVVIKFLLISLAIYLGMAMILIVTDRPTPIVSADEPVDFGALTAVSYQSMPDLQPYTARDGSALAYRLYQSSNDASPVLILLHGSS